MRTTSKIVLVIIIITLVYSVVKLINASIPQTETIATITWPIEQTNQNTTNSQAPQTQNAMISPAPTTQKTAVQNNTNQSKPMYQTDEILIDGQGQAGQNYIDITSDTPITPQQQNTNITQSGGAYAQATASINNESENSSAQYAPGMPASEVLYGN